MNQIDCKNCDATYVRKTSRRLDIRIKEHSNNCNNEDETNALYTYVKNSNHKINFNKVKILDKEGRLDSRLLSEMFHISSLLIR